MDPYKILKIAPNPDGTITRLATPPLVPPTESPTLNLNGNEGDGPIVLSKDVPLNPSKNTFVRIFRPTTAAPAKRLPLIIYFHGGGFVFYSAASIMFHESCNTVSAFLPAVIVSVDYRLAPEHRLPAAYEDAVEAIAWVKDQVMQTDAGEAWLRDYADFKNCFLMGSSSGGNIAYNAGLRALDMELLPLKIQGLIINQPYFGGVEWSESELRLSDDKMISLVSNELMWSLALPEGANRDHEYANPMVKGQFDEKIGRLSRCFLNGYGGDPLVDRQRELGRLLESRGVEVVKVFHEDGYHAVELFEPAKFQALVKNVGDFVRSCVDAKEQLAGMENNPQKL